MTREMKLLRRHSNANFIDSYDVLFIAWKWRYVDRAYNPLQKIGTGIITIYFRRLFVRNFRGVVPVNFLNAALNEALLLNPT